MLAWEQVQTGDGFNLYQLSQAPLGVQRLEWAPGGRQLVLHVITGKPDHLGYTLTFPLIVDIASNNAWSTLIEDTSYCLRHTDWSPDGRRYAYLKDRQLWIADARDGTSQQQGVPPTAEGIYTLRYSPDGERIAFLSGRVMGNRVVYDLWLRSSASGQDELLVEDAGYGTPVWSQDSSKISLLSEYGSLWIIDLSGGKTSQADLNPVPGSGVCLSPPEWVAASSEVLAAIRGTPNVWLVDLDGNAGLLLPDDAGGAKRPPGLSAPLKGGPSAGASASPDGANAVFWTHSGDEHLVNFNTGEIIALRRGRPGKSNITWSPVDPQFISKEFGVSLILVNAEDGSARELEIFGIAACLVTGWQVPRLLEVGRPPRIRGVIPVAFRHRQLAGSPPAGTRIRKPLPAKWLAVRSHPAMVTGWRADCIRVQPSR